MNNSLVEHGDDVAYIYGSHRLTYSQFVERIKRIAAAFHSLGARSQMRIGVLGMNSLDYCTVCGACEYHGFVASTINFRLSAKEMAFIIADSSPRILAFDASYSGILEAIRDQIPSVQHFVAMGDGAPGWAHSLAALVEQSDPKGPPMEAPRAADIALLLYTSGTTGRPKGAILSQSSMASSAQMVKESIDLGSKDKTLVVMPSFHIGGKNWENAQRHVGGTVVIGRGFDAGEFLQTIERERITVTLLAPTMIEALLEHPDFRKCDLTSLRAIIYSAAAMPMRLLRRALLAFGPIFVHQYGQTEGIGTTLSAAEHRLDGDEASTRRLSSIGKPFHGCRVKVVDDEDRDVPAGATGELCLQGPAIMTGYWNNSAATVDTLLGGWLHTGDIGRIDSEGYIYLVDRKRDVIISGGENIYSLEVENAIMQIPAVLTVAVIGIPDPKWGEAVWAVVVPKPGCELTEAEVIASCRANIATYKAPKRVLLVDDIPRLPSGKIAKNEIRQSLRARLGSGHSG